MIVGIFLPFWTLGGIWVVYCLLWAYAGKEIFEIGSQFLKYRWSVPIFGYSRVYAIANAANLRITPYNHFDLYFPRFLPFPFYKDRHTLSFDHRRKKHLLGISFDEADAKLVMNEPCKGVKLLGAGRNDVEEEVGAS